MQKLLMGLALLVVTATGAQAEIQKVTIRADGMC